jgi:hypothetical protein
MDVEKLIEAVASQPVHNHSNRKLYTYSEKSAAWNEIAAELGLQFCLLQHGMVPMHR